MDTKKAFKAFRYRTDVTWGSGRRAVVTAEGKAALDVSSPPEFKGEPGLWTPEDLFVASVNACTLMTFVAYAQAKGLELAGYESSAEGVLEYAEGKYRFTEIILRPRLAVKSPADIERAREVLEKSHELCFVSNSISAAVKIEPQFEVVAAAA